jgi:folate-binding protein YgfZ
MSMPPQPLPLPDGALHLSDWGLMRAAGPDARSFLQGQLTQDVQTLAPGEVRLAGYCSAKGRLLASFLVWAVADDELLLACSADLAPAMVKRLSMFVLRAKCRITDASNERALWGVAGAATERLPGFASLRPWRAASEGSLQVLRLPDAPLDAGPVARALVVLPVGERPPVEAALEPAAWQALEVRAGVPRIVAATSDRFVPQMVNLELVGGVSFQKGCYPGQEVVARSQYRGTLKRRGFVVQGAAEMAPAQEVFHSADPGQPAGMVVLAGQLAPGWGEALVELKLAAAGDGTLHLGSADGPPLRLGRLPYEVPADAA